MLTIMPDLHENINDLDLLATKIKAWGNDLGFQKVSIVKPDLKNASHKLKIWLDQKYHGSMDWMEKHGEKRYVPEKLVERTVRVISLRMNYLSDNKMIAVLKDDNKAYISRYALGSDYHKIIRKKLSTLAKQIEKEIPTKNINQRAFVDSAPVLEKPIAAQGGLGWIGKNTLLIDDSDGSWFFSVRYTPRFHFLQITKRHKIYVENATLACEFVLLMHSRNLTCSMLKSVFHIKLLKISEKFP